MRDATAPVIDPASMIGAIRAKIHSNLWSIVPATAYSGLEKSHSRYEPPIDASAIRTSVVAAAIAMQRACSTRRLDSCARANWSFSTSSFSESACRPPARMWERSRSAACSPGCRVPLRWRRASQRRAPRARAPIWIPSALPRSA